MDLTPLMSIAASNPLPARAAYTDEPIFRLSVDQYHELIRSGKLTDEDPVELLEGILVFKMPKKTPHATATRLCRRAIEPLLPVGWFYDAQEPITLSDGEPEPDGIIVRGRIEDYTRAHPRPRDIALVIEVSDTTLERDQGIKLRSYARAGIAEYWILDLTARAVRVHTDPDPPALPTPRFRSLKQYEASEVVPLGLDGQVLGSLSVDSLLPPSE